MRIVSMRVEQIGASRDGRNLLVARGQDVVHGWRYSFVVPATEGERVTTEVRAGGRPVIKIREYDALPWSGVMPVAWEPRRVAPAR